MSLLSLLLSLLLVLLVIAAFIMAGTQTPPFRNRLGGPVAGSIAEQRWLVLGGTDQYVLLRGRQRTAPLLLFLHGGPGTSEMPFHRLYNAMLEESFVTIHWDQLGTGKSYSKKLEPSDLSLERLTRDLDQLIDFLRADFGRERVMLVGHSWGSVLGLEYVTRFPEKVDAYIGVGVVSDSVASDTAGLEWALDQARAQQDRHGCKKLAALEPPPFSLRDVRVQRHYIRKYGGTFHQPRSLFALLLEALEPSEVSWLDLIDFFRGGRFSLAAFWPWLRSFDANQAYPRVALPAYLLLGRHDHHVSSELAAEYFARLRAPHKELIWFENSAHAVPFEEPERFNAEIMRIARDLAVLPPL